LIYALQPSKLKGDALARHFFDRQSKAPQRNFSSMTVTHKRPKSSASLPLNSNEWKLFQFGLARQAKIRQEEE
jgi:hypothetical protein